MAQLMRWREEGNKIVVCLDANENIYHKFLGNALTNVDGLNMREVVGTFTGKQIGATYFQGQTPIDGVWATSDVGGNHLDMCHACRLGDRQPSYVCN